MNTQTMLANAIALMELNIMNPSEMPIDQALLAITAIAALAQAEAAQNQAEIMQRIKNEIEQIGNTLARMTDDMPLQIQAPTGIGIKGPY